MPDHKTAGRAVLKDPEWAEIAARLRTARSDARLSQQKAADLTGISRVAISDMETGERKVYALELAALARAYGCTAGYLVGEDDPEILDWKEQKGLNDIVTALCFMGIPATWGMAQAAVGAAMDFAEQASGEAS